jgi:hypothetical protein
LVKAYNNKCKETIYYKDLSEQSQDSVVELSKQNLIVISRNLEQERKIKELEKEVEGLRRLLRQENHGEDIYG